MIECALVEFFGPFIALLVVTSFFGLGIFAMVGLLMKWIR